MKVFLSSEGPDDLGDWCNPPQYHAKPPNPGVVEALLRQVAQVEFTIAGARVWKRIRKYKAGDHARPETRNILGLMLEAEELGCDVVVFSRDRDGYPDRQVDIEEGIERAKEKFKLSLVGGIAVEEMEAWILAILGERKSEDHADPKEVLRQRHKIVDRAGKLEAIERNALAKIPEDAASLHAWLAAVTVAFKLKG